MNMSMVRVEIVGMKVSREQVARNKERILDEAGRLFREKGFDAVSVAEVMKAAGLTHGGFYGHFASKDDLIAHAVAHILAASPGENLSLDSYLDAYLSPWHRDNAATGCPTAALAGDVRRQDIAVQAAMSQGVRLQLQHIAEGFPEMGPSEKRRSAIGSWAAMVGAVILARAIDDPNLSDEILVQTRAWINDGINGCCQTNCTSRRSEEDE